MRTAVTGMPQASARPPQTPPRMRCSRERRGREPRKRENSPDRPKEEPASPSERADWLN